MPISDRHIFILTETSSTRTIADAMPAMFPFIEAPREKTNVTLLDTFDWRLFLRGWRLSWQNRPGGQHQLVLSGHDDQAIFSCDANRALPRFVTDISDPKLRDYLSAVIEMRALLPRARIDSRIRTYRVLDDNHKTIVRLNLEESTARPASGNQRIDMPAVVRITPVKGYEKELQVVRKTLLQQFNLVESGSDHYQSVLESIGEKPGAYSSKIDVELFDVMNAHQAARKLLQALLQTILLNLEGTRKDIDSEFLHDFRVAIRRTRSALSQIKDVFDADLVEQYKEGFAWLGSLTGPTRDLDVFLLSYDDYHGSLPAALQPDLEPFRGFLENHQKIEQKRMRRRLSTQKFNTLLTSWENFLQDDELPPTMNASRPVTIVAQERIWKIYRKVLKEGRAITDDSPDEELHELRKSCKKLRYMIEFFSSLFPDNKTRPLIKKMKNLLDNLGEFNDISVQIESIEGFARQMTEEGNFPSRTLIALGVLVGDLFRRHDIVRHEFKNQFAAFDTAANDNNYRQLFKAGK